MCNFHVKRSIVRYEDMHGDATKQLRRVLDFIGLPEIAENTIQEAVKYAHFENMRIMELNDIFQSKRLKPLDKNDPESYKTRLGKVGGYLNYLNQADIAYLNQKLTELSDFYKE